MRIAQRIIFCVVLGSCLVSAGCQHLHSHDAPPPDVPREKNKTYLADYIINPPDILVIDLLRAVPIPPYKIKPQDLLYINVKGIAAGEDAIKGVFRVEPDGTVHLGPSYGSLSVEDLSLA